MHDSLGKHITTELNVNRMTATLSSNFGARYEQATASYKCNQGHGWIDHVEQNIFSEHLQIMHRMISSNMFI